MVIVFVIENYSVMTNGTIMTANRFAEGLRAAGHTVRIVSNDIEGMDEFSYSVKERVMPIISKVSAKNDIRFAQYDEEVFKRAFEGADVVHFFMPWQFAIKGRKLAEKMGIATTAAYHCQPENVTYNIGMGRARFVADYIYDRFRNKFYKHVEIIHCPSEFIANQLRIYDYHSKMYVISNGVNDRFVPEPTESTREYDIDKKDVFNIMMIGRLAPEKRQDLIINAVNNSKYRDKIQLTFAGKGPSYKKLKQLCEELKLPHEPEFNFFTQDEIRDKILNTDLYVHASDIEIEGISCMEAFSCGRVPVISNARLSATPQFALDERSLFTQNDYMDLASKIDYWIEHPEERRAMEKEYGELGKKYRLDHSIKLAEQMFLDAISDQKSRNLIKEKKADNIYRRATTKMSFKNFCSFLLYYGFAYPILWCINRLGNGLRIKNKKNLRKAAHYGAVTISNHIHLLDCSMIAQCVFTHKPKFTTLPSNFKMPVAGLFVEMLGGVPIPSTAAENRVFFYELTRNLVKTKYVHFYPEGHLESGNEELREFKRGAFFLAVGAKCPVIPIRFVFRERKGLYKLFGKKKCITAIIGEPIFPDSKLPKDEAIRLLKQQSEDAMKRLGDEYYNTTQAQ